jgi:gliding motility-associated protein GldE
VLPPSFHQHILLTALNTQSTTVLVFLLLILIAFSFIVSGAEVAFFSLTYKDINLLKTKPQPAYKRIINLLEQPKSLLASLLIANSFANIAIIIISNIVIDDAFQFENVHSIWMEFALKVVVVTSVILLFCEVIPKIYASQNNIRFAKDLGIVVEGVYYIFKRVGGWMVAYTDIIERRLANKNNNAYSLEELDHAIDITTSNTASEKEKNILKGIVKFGNITVKQVMKTRLDVNGIDYKTNFGELVKKLEELHYSRVPVYKEDLDEVVGMLHTKDILPYLNEAVDFDWHGLMRQPYFVHEHKFIEDLLNEFQSKHIHFAVVVDEFGGTSGIVTLEDIMEEIIGDIRDEFDEEETGFKKLDEYNYVFEGSMMINNVCKLMNLPDNTFDAVKGESDSLAGLVLEIAGEIPPINQPVVAGDFEFTPLEFAKNRLQKIKITIKPRPEE